MGSGKLSLMPGRTAGILGLGVSGASAARFLLDQGLRLKISERRPREQVDADLLHFLDERGVEAEFGGHSADFLRGLDLLVPAPGVPLDTPLLLEAKRRGIPLVGELALAAGRFQAPVIAVTGSNGKTTVTALIGHILRTAGRRAFVGGNIGTPLLDSLAPTAEDYDCVVLELSSFQLDLAGGFRPDIALLLNVTPDHLDRHGSLENYVRAKQRLCIMQRGGDAAILGADDPFAAATPLRHGVRRVTFGTGEDCDCQVEAEGLRLRLDGEEHVFSLAGTRLASWVNRLNAAAAVLAARLALCTNGAIQAGLADFRPAAHRMAEVATVNGVTWIDDSKATNIGAAAAALAGCKGPVVLIAGGRDKGGDYGLIADVIRAKARRLILIGEAAPLMERAWGGLVDCERADDMNEAVRLAQAAARPGDTVLLAPACSSFDMFRSYGERGDAFAAAVRALEREVRQ